MLNSLRKINYSSIIVSQFVSANRLHDMVQLNASQLTGYQKNEFDTSKFTSGLMLRTHSQYDLPSFGLGMHGPLQAYFTEIFCHDLKISEFI